MPPPARANNYGPNMHAPPALFGQQGGMQGQHPQHSLMDRDRFPQPQHHAHPQVLYAQQAQQQQQQQQQQQAAAAAAAAAARTSQAQAQAQQEKNLLNILGQQGRGMVNGANVGGAVTAAMGGGIPRGVSAGMVAEQRAAHTAAQQAALAVAAVAAGEACIRDVWQEDLAREMAVLREMVDRYPYIAMDTEFPGIVARPIGKFPSKADYHYQTLRCNVDMLKIIQLGITLADGDGNLCKVDGTVSTWQFNFKFSLEEDMYAADSIDLLTKSGIDFAAHNNNGINVFKFGELLITSGLVMMDDVKWISFHSGYDFGYLVKIMSCVMLPKEESEFRRRLQIFFPSLYDIKYLMKSCRNLKGGLQDIAEEMGIQRIGPQHQAGSDSLLTGNIFFQMRQRYFDGRIEDEKYLGQVWGLNGNGPSMLNGTSSSNSGSAAPNPPSTPNNAIPNGSNGGSLQKTPENLGAGAQSHGTPRNGTPRNGTPGTPGYTPAFGKMGM